VREFINGADVITGRDYEHELTPSNCYATGNTVLTDGRKIGWRIEQSRRGELFISDGSSSAYSAVYLYANQKLSKKFDEACDVECQHEP